MKHISILGSAGSIGTQTLDVAARHPREFKIVGIASYNEIELIEKQARKFKPKAVSLSIEEAATELRKRLKSEKIQVFSGSEGLKKIATLRETDTVVTAVVGSVGLLPTLEAIKAGKDIAVANKETLVCAGEIVMREVKRHKVKLMPIDSEHSAIFQCLQGHNLNEIERIILTCSGGPFRKTPEKELQSVTKEQALAHPTWKMGGKITIDSATLLNKGLEVIEAHWLYDIPYKKIDVIIHPQSIIHSFVEFHDGSMLAQIGVHDMRVPIQYALSYPKRLPSGSYAFLDLAAAKHFDFEAPDTQKFPCLRYAYEAGEMGGTMPAVMNASNEVAVVEFFLKGKTKFMNIPRTVRKTMDAHKNKKNPTLEDIVQADEWARRYARSVLELKN